MSFWIIMYYWTVLYPASIPCLSYIVRSICMKHTLGWYNNIRISFLLNVGIGVILLTQNRNLSLPKPLDDCFIISQFRGILDGLKCSPSTLILGNIWWTIYLYRSHLSGLKGVLKCLLISVFFPPLGHCVSLTCAQNALFSSPTDSTKSFLTINEWILK